MKPKPQPQVILGRSLGATEIQIPGITNDVMSLSPTVSTADTDALPAAIEPGMLIRIASTEDVYIRWDSSAVDADDTDTLFTRGVEAQLVPKDVTHFSCLSVGTDGVVTVTLFQ